MSRFTIYKANKSSITRMFHRHRIVSWTVIILVVILGVSGIVSDLKDFPNIIFLLVLIAWAILLVILWDSSRKIERNLEKLGELKITLEGITKTIGSLVERYAISSLKQIRVKKHLRTRLITPNIDGAGTYLVTMMDTNSHKEFFIVSSRSEDKPEINLIDLLRKLEKSLGNEILSVGK